MKKLVMILIPVLLCMLVAVAFADGSCGPNVTWKLDANGTLTISGTGPMESFRYSSNVPWNNDKDNIRNVVVEDGVTSIGDHAFYWCRKLTSVTLPESVTMLGDNAFENCNELLTVNIPSGVTIIPEWCFYGCDKLTSLVLPDGLTTIDKLAFCDCGTLTTLTIPASVTNISTDRTFKGCNKLTRIDVADGSAAYVSVDGVLYNKDQSMLICYPGGKTETTFTVPDSVTSINAYAFYWNGSIVNLTVPGTVKTIGEDAFAGCKKMTSITFGEGITSIGTTAFQQCNSLTSILFPASLVSLGDDMFESCSKLTSIDVAEGSTAFCSDNGVLFSADKTKLVAFPPASPWAAYSIPEGVTTIGKYAFLYSKNLVSVTFPSTLITIESSAFNGCNKLATVELPEGLVSIDYHAFNSCDALSVVTIPSTCASLGDGVFNWDKHLTSVTIKSKITSFDKWGVFKYCADSLTIYAPAGSTTEAHCTENGFKFVATSFDAPAATAAPAVATTSSEATDLPAGSWVCSECNATMTSGKFCSECGAQKPQRIECLGCGYAIPDGMVMTFCPDCGLKFGESATPSEPAATPIPDTKADEPETKEIALEDMSLEELYVLQTRVETAISEKQPAGTVLYSGAYVAGKDIDVGAYIVTVTAVNEGSTTCCLDWFDSEAAYNSYSYGEHGEYHYLEVGSSYYINLTEGSVLYFYRGTGTIEPAKQLIAETSTLHAGHYVAGKDIPSGKYVVTAATTYGDYSSLCLDLFNTETAYRNTDYSNGEYHYLKVGETFAVNLTDGQVLYIYRGSGNIRPQ